jgi:hypothetical protein
LPATRYLDQEMARNIAELGYRSYVQIKELKDNLRRWHIFNIEWHSKSGSEESFTIGQRQGGHTNV